MHFRKIYQEPSGEDIEEIIKLTSYLPRFMDQDQNEDSFAEVSKKELKVMIGSFQKSNI
jgi:hypothetical protein